MVRLYHHVGDQEQEAAMTARLHQLEQRLMRVNVSDDHTFLDQVQQILDIVISVAGYVASGEAANQRLRAL